MKKDERPFVTMKNSEFERGDFVWAKMKGSAWWPAMVLDPHDCKKNEESDSNKYWLFWFGSHTVSQVENAKISHFKRGFLRYFDKSSKKQFVKAVEEALSFLAKANDLKYDHASELLHWATSGFGSNWVIEFRWAKSEFPQFVQDALSQRMETSSEESDIQVLPSVVSEVRKGNKSLEEICIACCRENVELVEFHPLFVGKICEECKIDVKIVCALPPSEFHDLCIICGQGGTLISCSDEICSRAFCKVCIEYLHSEKAYVEILKKDYWQCYFCADQDGECLIQRRVCYELESDCIILSPNNVQNSVVTDTIIKKVLNGEKSLEEICIGCCKEDAILIKPHPFFVGRICKRCEKDVDRICNKPCGRSQRYCIVCGQGGTLVFCSSKLCRRAFCQECIELLHSKVAFAKICKENYWQCYLCSNENGKCLIQRRVRHQLISDFFLRNFRNFAETDNIVKRVRNGEKTLEDDIVKQVQNGEKTLDDDVVKQVQNGKKTLEDICIGCCKKDAILIKPHPLFVGKVCKTCEKDVDRIYNKPCGKTQLYCIVCGQGGTLVYCSSKPCRRAFCQECIDLLHSKEAFSKICKKDYWLCYLCSNENGKCLIQRRKCPQVVSDSAVKFPMNFLTSMETDDVVKQVQNGEKKLEDICIGCCKKDALLIKPHPLFVGKVCKACEKDVDRIYNKPCGKTQLYCIVCGQGGSLVYCSSKPCRRAFCQECIELLHSKKAFTKIVKKDSWLCYLCSDQNGNCLIQRRVRHQSASNSIVGSPVISHQVHQTSATMSPINILNCMEPDDIIKQVQDGKKNLEDICIGCCKEDAILIKPHPLFVGKVCKRCEKDVDRIYSKPCGKIQRYCIVCGQGGTLVYCSLKLCYRAYCQECIELLHSKKAFVKIVRSSEWICYYCDPNERHNCLIRRRNQSNQDIPHSSKCTPVPTFKPRKKHCQFPVKSTTCTSATVEIVSVVESVLNRKKSLEDICIACCRKSAVLVSKHPLFIGGICKDCKKDVSRICSRPYGRFQKFCVVCGQGGNLVYCSKNVCLRAYCQSCIEYLVSQKAYSKILKNDNWLCFMCTINENNTCLIKNRTFYDSVVAELPAVRTFTSSMSASASIMRDSPS